MPGKRKKDWADEEVGEGHANGQDGETTVEHASSVTNTPSKPRRGRPPGSTNKPKPNPTGILSQKGTPSKPKGKVLFSTPSKPHQEDVGGVPLPIERNADRSARRNSARNLLDRAVTNGLGDDDDLLEEDIVARQIWDEDDDRSDVQQGEEHFDLDSTAPDTPSKRKSGRQKKKKSPTPPPDLPPHERYFWDNRPGKIKTSNNTLSALLTHSQYHTAITSYTDPHTSCYTSLHNLHTRSFPQWRFELSQRFSICLYGYGSKRHLVKDFAKYLHQHTTDPKILITNGYTPTLTPRHLLNTLANLVYTPSTLPKNLGAQPPDMLSTLLTHLTAHPPNHPIHIFINSLDAPPLRKPATQSLLSTLAAHPSIHMLATCDTPNFPLLWPTTLRDTFNFVFHDTTTFLSYSGVEIPHVVDEVNTLLARSGRSLKGKEGVGFVLRSLPENARALYRVLISEVLLAMDDGDGDGEGGEGVEYKQLYRKAVEEFICSSEMGFRTLLKEFRDHEMVVERVGGGLGVPWTRGECEGILEELG